MDVLVVENSTELKTKLKDLSKGGAKVSFVPTMGALHQGHIELVRAAKQVADIVIVSIFVNPKQFDRKQDFCSYPSQLDRDIKLLDKEGVSLIYTPKADEFYKSPFYTKITLPELSDKLCGSARPGHFDGVAIVIVKLFNLINPNYAFFGLKDYQQYVFIKQLSADLNLAPEVIGVDTVREKSGLAMSSRNLNLSAEQREEVAPRLVAEMNNMADLILQGHDYKRVILEGKKKLLTLGFSKVDYLEILQNDLSPYKKGSDKARIFAAVFIDKVRLIDNISIC